MEYFRMAQERSISLSSWKVISDSIEQSTYMQQGNGCELQGLLAVWIHCLLTHSITPISTPKGFTTDQFSTCNGGVLIDY